MKKLILEFLYIAYKNNFVEINYIFSILFFYDQRRYPLPPIERNLTEVLEDNQITSDMVAFAIIRLILALSCKMVLYGIDIAYLIKHSVFVSLNQYVLYTIVIRGSKDVWYWTVGTFQAIEITKDVYVLWIAFIAYSSEYLFDWGAVEDEL